MNVDFFKRIWLDFRNGHSTYLSFILAFSNTIMIVYYFLIDRLDFLNNTIFDNIVFFVLLLLMIYIPLAIILGKWHVKSQYKTEVVAMWEEWPYMAKTLRVLLDMSNDKFSKEELESLRKFFLDIEKNKSI